MAIKRKGVLTKAGTYAYGDLVEVKTAEELKAAAERQPIIMLTRGHPPDGVVSAKDVIGTVSQKWNEEHQQVNMEVWAHEEKLTDEEREKFVNLEPIPVSGGFAIDDIGENNEQLGIVYTHVAMLSDEDPRCPLGECGINIRMDSKDGHRLVRFDQKSDLEAPKEPAPEPTPEESEVEPTKEEAPAPVEEPVADTVETVAEPEPVLENQEVASEDVEIPRESTTIIPASTTAKSDPGFRKVDGMYEYTPKAYRTEGKDE